MTWKKRRENRRNPFVVGGAREVRKRYGLRSTAEVAQAIKYLEKNELITATETGHGIDNPYFRGWIRLRALPDVGVILPLL